VKTTFECMNLSTKTITYVLGRWDGIYMRQGETGDDGLVNSPEGSGPRRKTKTMRRMSSLLDESCLDRDAQ
jgi:hypothetical protein